MTETRDENLSSWCHNLVGYCLYTPEEVKGLKESELPPADAIIARGVAHNFAFHPGRIEEKKGEIKEILDRMPKVFHIQHGGGMTFLNLCQDKDGNHWAEHPTMEGLVVLGIAAKMASFPIPKETWILLPGGVPYVTFDTRTDAEKEAAMEKAVSNESVPV